LKYKTDVFYLSEEPGGVESDEEFSIDYPEFYVLPLNGEALNYGYGPR